MVQVPLTRRQLGLALTATAGLALTATPVQAQTGVCSTATLLLETGMTRLLRAYPAVLETIRGNDLLWRDGTRMPVRLHPADRTLAAQVAEPDLAAQTAQTYPRGSCRFPAPHGSDPGRIRFTPFFARMYGATPAAVERNLKPVDWPTRRPGGTIAFNVVNGAADALARVAQDLQALPRDMHRFFDRPAGGYYWRRIAGTDRLSAHAFGIAIDINLDMSDYWRDEVPGMVGEPADWRPTRPRNRIPQVIVDIFERAGFIWGGKWHHYDTMHFEYRPELLLA